MRVLVTVSETTLDGDYDEDIDSVCVECTRCKHSVDVYGTTDRSVRRGCIMLRDECPMDEDNFYASEEL